MLKITRGAILLMCLGLPFANQARAQEDFQAVKQELHAKINRATTTAELLALAPLSEQDLLASLASFLPNADGSGAALPPGVTPLTPATLNVIIQVFTYPMGEPSAVGLRQSLLAKMSREQQFRLVQILLLTGGASVAGELAGDIRRGGLSGGLLDAVQVIEIQANLLAKASADPAGLAKLLTLTQSTNADVAHWATVLYEAITGPTTPESLFVGQQLFETYVHDLNYREKGIAEALVLAASSQAIFTQAEAGSDPDRNALMARILAVAANSGFHVQNIALIDWAFQKAVALNLETTEHGITPRFAAAYVEISNDQYADAAQAFAPVFDSGINCELAAEAGVMIAGCMLQMHDDAGAILYLDQVIQRFPTQTEAIKKATDLKSFLQARSVEEE